MRSCALAMASLLVGGVALGARRDGEAVAPRARLWSRNVRRESLGWHADHALLKLRLAGGARVFSIGDPLFEGISPSTVPVDELHYDMGSEWFEVRGPGDARHYVRRDLTLELEDGTRHQVVHGSIGKVQRQLARLGVAAAIEPMTHARPTQPSPPPARTPRARPPNLERLLDELERIDAALDQAPAAMRARGFAGDRAADELAPEVALAGAAAMIEELGDAVPMETRGRWMRVSRSVATKTAALRAVDGATPDELHALRRAASAATARGWEIVRTSDRGRVDGAEVVATVRAGEGLLARRRVEERAVVDDEGGYETDGPSGRDMWTTRPYRRATTVSRVTEQHDLPDLPALRAFLERSP